MWTNIRRVFDAPIASAGAHVLALLVLQVLAADQPERAGPAGEAQDQDDREHALLVQHRGDREDQQQDTGIEVKML
jgi:hypothetical protein